MELFNPELLTLSIQQSEKGQLPQGIVQEISDAGKLAEDLFKTYPLEKILEIDRKTLRDPSYWAEDIVKDFSRRKLYSRWLPKMFGGGGGHPLSFFGLNLEMGSRCLGISNLLGAHYVAMGLISATSSFEILERLTADISRAEDTGAHCTVALAITEPDAGSDMEDVELLERARVCTKAVKVPGGYRISGQKLFISNSLFSKWLVVSAFEDFNHPADSTVIFAVKSDTKGITFGRTERKMGQGASPATVIFFEDVFIPEKDVCFSPAQFQKHDHYLANAEFLINDLLSLSRAGVGCLAAGAQKRILELGILNLSQKDYQNKEWAQTQVAKLSQNFIVSKTIAWEGHMECYSRGPYKDLQKPLVYSVMKGTPSSLLKVSLGKSLHSASARDILRKKRRESISMSDEKLIFGWGSLAKSFCTGKAMESARLLMEMVTPDGSLLYQELEKITRDLKLLEIYEGTNELNNLMCFKNFIGPAHQAQRIFKE